MTKTTLCASALSLLTVSVLACSSQEPSQQGPGAGGASAGAAGFGGGDLAGTAGTLGAGGASSGGAGAGGASAGATSSGGAGAGEGGAGGAAAGAGGTTGGAAGSAGAGAGGGGGCGTALICDNFEDHAVGQEPGAPWKKNVDDHGGVVVTNEEAFSGTQSIKVTLDGNPGYKRAYFFTEGAPLFPAAKDMLWGRMMIKTAAAPNDGVHWTNIEGQGPVPGKNYRALIRYGGQHMGRLMANYETQGVGSDCWHHSQQAMPTGEWACMEWQFDAANDTMRFYLNGTEVADLTVLGQTKTTAECVSGEAGGKWEFPEFDKLSLGLELYQNDPARTLYIDDVALGTERIPCPSP